MSRKHISLNLAKEKLLCFTNTFKDMNLNLLKLLMFAFKQMFYVFIIQVLAINFLSANPTNGQRLNKIIVSIQVEDATLEEIFTKLEDHTNFTFGYHEGVISDNQRLSLSYNKVSLLQILNTGSSVSISAEEVKPRLCNRSSITSLTHFKSAALLCLPSHHSGAMLSKPNYLIYGELKSHHEPYCIIQVKVDGVIDVSRMLEGRVAGVNVQNVSGTFGAGPKITICGASSVTGDTKPLWVIDGVVQEDLVNLSFDDLVSGDSGTLIGSSVADLNFNDISSFEILKDASATAIYGERALNGVIVITTKKGVRNAPLKFNYQGEFTTRNIPNYRQSNILNSKETLAVLLQQDKYKNDLATIDFLHKSALLHLF